MKLLRRYGVSWRCRNVAALQAVMLITLMCAGIVMGAPAKAQPVRLLIFGDSLVAGYNLPPDAAYPVQLEKALKARGITDVTVLNAGVSGDTTAAARARLEWALADKPTHVLVELGANDMLRGLSPDQARTNLDAIITKLKQANLPVLMAGMLAAPNLGADYGRSFNAIYPDLASKYGLPLYPFFLDGVAGDAKLNLGDGIHPTREGVAIIVERTMPHILRFLGR